MTCEFTPPPSVGRCEDHGSGWRVGGARFLLGVQRLLGLGQFGAEISAATGDLDHELTAVVNIGDDAWMYGVRICPDLDTCMYTWGWHRPRTRLGASRRNLERQGGIGGLRRTAGLVRIGRPRSRNAFGPQPDAPCGGIHSQVTEALCRRWSPEPPSCRSATTVAKPMS